MRVAAHSWAIAGLVYGNGLVRGVGLLADPNTNFRISPVLTTLVALEYHRRSGNFKKHYGSAVVLSGPSDLEAPDNTQKIQDWLNVQVPQYEAQLLHNSISTSNVPTAANKKL